MTAKESQKDNLSQMLCNAEQREYADDHLTNGERTEIIFKYSQLFPKAYQMKIDKGASFEDIYISLIFGS